MEKPFDFVNLRERLKAKGLDVAENLIEVLAGETLDWTAESCAQHENSIVKLGAPAILAVKPFVMGQIDKLDGKPGV